MDFDFQFITIVGTADAEWTGKSLPDGPYKMT